MKRVVLISRYFCDGIGGAEKSILEELKKYKNRGHSIYVISFDPSLKSGFFIYEGFRGKNYRLNNMSKVFSVKSKMFISRKEISKILKKELKENDLVLLQSETSPIAGNFCLKNKIEYIYYIRDKSNLNEDLVRFHVSSFKDILEFFREKSNFYFKRKYEIINKNVLKNAKEIIANSNYIKNELKKKFNLDSKVVYPKIDYSKLSKNKMRRNRRYIGFVGGNNYWKGLDIILKIAKKMPEEHFLVTGFYKKIKKKGNVLFVPRQKDVMNFYGKIKILLVPSRFEESYGRVVKEAEYLKIPVISSNKGGLLEANKNKDNIIKDLENASLWKEKIIKNEKTSR